MVAFPILGSTSHECIVDQMLNCGGLSVLPMVFFTDRRQFFLLTGHEIQCWNTKLRVVGGVSKVWSYEIVSTDVDTEFKKDLAGQKHVWLLDMQVDDKMERTGGSEVFY
eukprot:Gb_09504 [translate_table: standard]